MIQYKYIFIIVWLCFSGTVAAVAGQEDVPVNIRTLMSQPRLYNGKTVVIEGEAVGPVLREGNSVWVNIHDGEQAVGIWMRASLGSGVRHTGGYGLHGDTLKISGVFNGACALHGGDTDIHAAKIIGYRSGYRVRHPVTRTKKYAVMICLIVALFSVVTGVMKERSL